MDAERDELRELGGLVRALAIQVGKLEVAIPLVTAQAETIQDHGERLAGLATWRDEHEKADEKRSKRLAAWAGVGGALLMKLLDWAHSHLSDFMSFGSHAAR